MPEARTVLIDAAAFRVRFAGFGAPLAVDRPDGSEVVLAPWTCRDHLRALGSRLVPGPDGIELDAEGFADDVLANSGLEGDAAAALRPLALWWAAAGAEGRPMPAEDGWTSLGSARARLRPWTAGERFAALQAHLATEPDGALSLDVAGYVDSMLASSVAAIEPGTVGDCDAAATAALLEAVADLNVAQPLLPGESEPREATRAMAASTLRICRALGWTPSEVWGTPSAEVDRIIELLDLLEPAPVRAPVVNRGAATVSAPLPGHSALALQPDAIVIRIEDSTR